MTEQEKQNGNDETNKSDKKDYTEHYFYHEKYIDSNMSLWSSMIVINTILISVYTIIINFGIDKINPTIFGIYVVAFIFTAISVYSLLNAMLNHNYYLHEMSKMTLPAKFSKKEDKLIMFNELTMSINKIRTQERIAKYAILLNSIAFFITLLWAFLATHINHAHEGSEVCHIIINNVN